MTDEADPDRVSRDTRRGLSWNLVTAVATNAMRFGLVAVLGRTLDSRDFGVVAAAISVMVLFYAIRDFGIGRALVQSKAIDEQHLSTGFAVSTYLGLVLGAGVLLSAPLVGKLYRIPASVDILRALSVLFALRGLTVTSRMMLQRNMKLRTTALIDQVSFLVGAAVSVALSIAGGGPWSLVAGYVTEEALATVLYLRASPAPWSLKIHVHKLRELIQFGVAETISQVAATLATYGDNFVVGNALGARALGFYTRAYDLIKFPATVFDKIAGNVLFPMFSRFQDDPERLAAGLRRAMFINATVLLPASAALLIVAPEAIRLLLGPGWEETVLPFRVLSLTMLMRTSWKVGAWIAGAAGLIRGVAIINTLYMVAAIGGAIFAVQWGIVGVACSTAMAITVAFAGTSYLALKISGLSLRRLIAAHLPGIALALAVTCTAWPLATALRSSKLAPVVVFAAVAMASILVCVAILVVGMKRFRGDFDWLRSELTRVIRRDKPRLES